MKQTRKEAVLALSIILISAVVGWLLYVAALYSDVAMIAGIPTDELYGDEPLSMIHPSKFLIFAAIAVLAFGALLSKRKVLKIRASSALTSRLAEPVQQFASTVIIISLVLAAIAAITSFMSSFFDDGTAYSTTSRIVDAYLPIVLYTVLVVVVMLLGFVFSKNPAQESIQPVSVSPEHASTADHSSLIQRKIGISFTIPIVAVAIALILGLIVYDITRTSLEVWIWVIILTIVALGIILGTLYAQKGLTALTDAGKPHAGASIGAQNLSFILSILFVVSATFMSLGFASGAVDQLKVQHDLTISIYSDQNGEFMDFEDRADLERASLTAYGSGLLSRSPAIITLEPDGMVLTEEMVDNTGYLNIDTLFPANLPEGDLELTLSTSEADGTALTLELPMTINPDGTAQFVDGSNAYTSSEMMKLGAITGSWFVKELLPSLMMLLLILSTIFFTLTIRNRDYEPEAPVITKHPLPAA